MTYLTVVPAYGRIYKSKKEVTEAYVSGKDFQIVSIGPHEGRYISKADKPDNIHFTVRYGANREKVMVIK